MSANNHDDYLPPSNLPPIGKKWENNHDRPLAARIIHERIVARENGLPEPTLGSYERTQHGRIIGTDLAESRALDDALAAAKKERGR